MEGLARPALRKGPEDVAVGDNQHVAVRSLCRLLAHDGRVPLLPDFLDQAVKALRDVGRAPARLLDFAGHENTIWAGRLTRLPGSHPAKYPIPEPALAASAIP